MLSPFFDHDECIGMERWVGALDIHHGGIFDAAVFGDARPAHSPEGFEHGGTLCQV